MDSRNIFDGQSINREVKSLLLLFTKGGDVAWLLTALIAIAALQVRRCGLVVGSSDFNAALQSEKMLL